MDLKIWCLTALCLTLAGLAPGNALFAQEEKADSLQSEKKKGPFKDYEAVITDAAVTDEGLFDVHTVDDKLFFEIPYDQLDKEMLLVSRISKLPPISPYVNAGSKVNEQVVRWERKGKKVHLRMVSYNAVADEGLPIYESVQNNNLEPILKSFDIEAIGRDSISLVIEAGPLFTDDVRAISGLSNRMRQQFKVSRLDDSRSFIDTVRSFPINIEVRHTMTYQASEPPSNSRGNTITMQLAQSMILLPEDKMQPRRFDDRVGWFTVSQVDYSSDALKSDEKEYIRRWRLEPSDPEAYARGELVEPVKPIIYYLDPATPEKWRPYFIQGIEDWQKCFETAGFKNAILAREAPSPEEDPDFSPEDARYSTVRYVASTTRNAVGPSVSDPRTGEILESDIIWYHNHLRSYRNRYLLETGAANPKARTLDTPEEEIGEMMRMVIAHEVGHALGLPHNMKASAAYPVDSLRSGPFTQQYGIATTIMDYARYNYVAQPGDTGIRFIRQIGPYDHYAINWGYRRIPGAEAPEDEKEVLNGWIKQHEGDPRYMFGGGGIDPTSQTECIGDDAMQASSYGMANLKRVLPNLIEWTTRDGENYDDLEELYGEFLGVWRRYVGHVLTHVGGVYETRKTSDQEGGVYEPVPGTKQRQAVQWLNDNAFMSPEWLFEPEIIERISQTGSLERARSLQANILNSLLSPNRMGRLIEAEMLRGNEAYPLLEMMADLRRGLWEELYAPATTSVYRRNLQRAYLDRMAWLLKDHEDTEAARAGTNISQSDIRACVKAELRQLSADMEENLDNMDDRMTRLHWEDARDRIETMLEMGDS